MPGHLVYPGGQSRIALQEPREISHSDESIGSCIEALAGIRVTVVQQQNFVSVARSYR
jgi:hypothetical protein